MKLLVATNAAPFIRGGAELLADRLILELRGAGHQAELMRIPLGRTPLSIRDALIAAATMDVVNVDRVIGLKFPGYVIPHHDVVIWLVHQLRQVYDLDATNGGWPPDPTLDAIAGSVRAADRAAFASARRVYSISPVVAERLESHLGIASTVLLTPPHSEPTYRTEEAGGYLLALGRISDGKRQTMAVRGMDYASPSARLVIAGAADSQEASERLRDAVESSAARDRIHVIERFIDESEKVDLLARCSGSVYLPYQEDSYGYVCYEAAMSAKPTITCSDAGGALTLVQDRISGFVAEPDPASLGSAFTELLADPVASAALGRTAQALAQGLQLSWARVVEELTR